MKFAYTALTKDNKKITGVLEVETEALAQEELHKMGVAIISLKEVSDEEFQKIQKEQAAATEEKGIQTFQFVAIDPNGKEVEGTIDAKNHYSAYKRLRTEYQFKVNDLYPPGSTPENIAKFKATFSEYERKIEGEGGSKVAASKEKDELREAETELNKEFIAEIDKVIVNSKKTIEEHKELFSKELYREIQNTLGELERIRSSNNIKHISEVSGDLYELLSNPDNIEAETSTESYEELMTSLEDSALINKENELYRRALKMTKAKSVFGNISKKLKEITAPEKNEQGEIKGAINVAKSKIYFLLEKLSKPKKPRLKEVKEVKKAEVPTTKFGIFKQKLNEYFKTKSPVLKQARKQELKKAFNSLFRKETEGEKTSRLTKAREKLKKERAQEQREIDKAVAAAEAPKQTVKPGQKTDKAKSKELLKEQAEREKEILAQLEAQQEVEPRRSSGFFFELDSFIAWLLFFYLVYFFLAGFSLEKNIGLKPEFILRTLSSPMLINISIFLLLVHFSLRLRNLHFRGHFFTSIFLMFVTFGVYALLIANF